MSETQPNRTRWIERDSELARPDVHDLIAIVEWLAGAESTGCSIDLRDGDGYQSTYWRCRACGAERNRRSAFDEPCLQIRTHRPRFDDGYSIDDTRTRRAPPEAMVVDFVRF